MLFFRYLAEVQRKVDAADRLLADLCAQSGAPLRRLERDTAACARTTLALKNAHARQRAAAQGLLDDARACLRDTEAAQHVAHRLQAGAGRARLARAERHAAGAREVQLPNDYFWALLRKLEARSRKLLETWNL